MQTLYSLIALLLVMLLSLNFYQGRNHTQQNMIVNEVLTPFNDLGMELLDHIGRQAFDENTDETKIAEPTWPIVTSPSGLTAEASFGGCTDFWTCDDIDDFHGLTVNRDLNGLPYTVDISVRYVDELDPDQPTGGAPSYAKEVTLEISTAAIQMGGAPLTVKIGRVYTYDRITSTP